MNQNRGFIMASLLITTTLIVLMGTVIAQLVVTNYNLATREQHRINAQFAADAGLDYAITRLNESNDWTGTTGEFELLNNGRSRTTYEAVVLSGGGTQNVTIKSTGRTYAPASSTTPFVERSYEADLTGLIASGNFSLVTGVGGLIMNNNSKIVAGDVFVNGEIILNNSAQIGLSYASVNVDAAHQNCPDPPNSNYPEICDTAIHGPDIGEPISVNGNAKIYANVQANNQTTTDGLFNPGLVAGTVTPEPLPPHDREAQIDAIANTINGNLDCDSTSSIIDVPANTRITGDLTLKKQCILRIYGDVWVQGSVVMEQSTQLEIQESVGTDQPNIMVDDTVSLLNSATVISNSQETGVVFVTYKSSVSCSTATTGPCDVSGQNLYDSRNITTIEFNNSASAPESLLYAKWSRVNIINSGDIGALVGQTVVLNNYTAVTFGTSTEGVTPSYTYVTDSYRRVFD